MKIATWNVNGIRARGAQVEEWLERERPDVVCLQFTWWAPWRNLRARNIGWRLDYLLASPGLAARARSCVVQADVGTSDHAPVVMTTG